MTFEFMPERLYRMPVHFGPTPGPRQDPHGGLFDWVDGPKREMFSISFLTESRVLEAVLPKGFRLLGEPVVTVELQHWSELAWLAGRGYSTLGVKIPVLFRGHKDHVEGMFLAVLWENMPDAIISGREELGYNKLYADIVQEAGNEEKIRHEGSWMGHVFCDMVFSPVASEPFSSLPKPPGVGILNLKYIPSLHSASPDACYVTMSPYTGSALVYTRAVRGTGTVNFRASDWEQLPTLHHIVNTLAAWPVLEWRDAWMTHSTGAKDLSDLHRLE